MHCMLSLLLLMLSTRLVPSKGLHCGPVRNLCCCMPTPKTLHGAYNAVAPRKCLGVVDDLLRCNVRAEVYDMQNIWVELALQGHDSRQQ